MQALGFWRGVGAFHRGAVVIPELGDAATSVVGMSGRVRSPWMWFCT